MNRANPHGASFVTQNKFGLEATFIYCYSNGIDALVSLFSNKLHLLFKLAVLLKTEFLGGNKIWIYLLIWWKSTIFFYWLPLSHAVFDGVFFFFEYRLSNFMFTFLMNNCQIVKKWIHIYYKMFRSLSKGTPLNGISNPWQQALVGLGHCFGSVHS